MVPQNGSSYSLCEGLTARVSNQSFDKFNLHHNWEYKKRHIAIKMHSSLLVSCSLKLMAVSIKIWAWKFRISEISKFGNKIFEIFYRWFTIDFIKECTGYVIRYSSTNSIQIRYVISFEGAREIIMTHKLFLNSPHVFQFNYH